MTDESLPSPIDPTSREFLIDLFVGLRDDLADQVGGPASPEPLKAAQTRAIYEALLRGLENEAPFPDDEGLRVFVADLAEATDKANDYERVVLEHRALGQLSQAVAAARTPHLSI